MSRFRWLGIVPGVVLTASLLLGVSGCSPTGGKTTTGDTSTAETTQPKVELDIQAAMSLTDALNEATALYTREHPNVTFSVNYDASGTLQAQIEQGAPADLFISASKKNMDPLEQAGLLAAGTRTDILGNSLVIIVPKSSTLDIKTMADLVDPSVKVIALGDPASVPAGKYATQSLTAAGVNDAVQAKTVLGKDVRTVLTYVETGDADTGIVYKTDALISDKVKIAEEIDDTTHDPILYPAAVIEASTKQEAAGAFLDFLTTPDAMKIFENYGFRSVG